MTDLRALRQQIIRVAANAGEGHIPSALSICDLVYVLHKDVMRRESFAKRDRFLLSKGHGCLALYVVLAHLGRLPSEWLDHFCEDGADLLGHPERRPVAEIEATTGSLGHGLGMACGLALAEKIKGGDERIFCLVGDGELEEGSCWEAALLAARHNLSNLTVMVDANGTSPNRVDGVRHETCLAEKFRAFGWFVSRIDGHNHVAIRKACSPTGGDRPFVVICDTVKGYGCEPMEREPNVWHHRCPSGTELHGMLECVR